MNGDVVNGIFEFVGSLMIWLSARRAWQDKQVRGVSLWPVTFFTSWGFWNLYYYPSLAQMWSFAGGCSIVVANMVWLSLLWRYRKA